MKRNNVVIAVLLIVSTLLTSCGGGQNALVDNSQKEETPAVQEASGDRDLSNFNLDGSLPIVKDPEKYEPMTMAIVTPPERVVPNKDLDLVQQIAEETGLTFDWIEIPAAGSGEKINLMLATGTDLPDCFWNGISSEVATKYMDQDVFVPTEELIEEYSPRLVEVFKDHPEYKAGSTAPNGHSYGFPYIEEMYGLVLTPGPFLINKTWLDKVGKDVPTTVDEFVDCLRAFKEFGDLNGNGDDDEIPFAFGLGSQDMFGSYDTFHQFVGTFGEPDSYCYGNPLANHLMVSNDNKIVYTANTDSYKKTVELFHDLYKEGLLDEDSFSPGPSVDQPLFLNRLKGDVAEIGCFGVWAPVNEIPNPEVRKQYVPIPRLDGENGKSGYALNFSEMQDTSMVAITKQCPYPEAIAALVNYCWDPKISITLNWGSVGMVYKEDSEGYLSFDLDESDNIILKDNYQTFGELRNNSTPTRGSLYVSNDYYGKYADYTWDALDLLEFQKSNGKEEILAESKAVPKIMLSVEEQTKLDQISPQLSGIIDEYTMGFILDGNIEQGWPEYLKALEEAGLTEFLEVWNEAYDRFKDTVESK